MRNQIKVVTHPVSILNPKFKYTPAAKTDIRETFAKFGWVPPSEVRK